VTHAVIVVPPPTRASQALVTSAAADGITVTRLLEPDAAAALAPSARPSSPRSTAPRSPPRTMLCRATQRDLQT